MQKNIALNNVKHIKSDISPGIAMTLVVEHKTGVAAPLSLHL